MHFTQGESAQERMADLAMEYAGDPDSRIDGFYVEATRETESFGLLDLEGKRDRIGGTG